MLYCLNVGREYSKERPNDYCFILDTDDWVSECVRTRQLMDYIANGKLSVRNMVELNSKKVLTM